MLAGFNMKLTALLIVAVWLVFGWLTEREMVATIGAILFILLRGPQYIGEKPTTLLWSIVAVNVGYLVIFGAGVFLLFSIMMLASELQ
jgi:hypothetical protein